MRAPKQSEAYDLSKLLSSTVVHISVHRLRHYPLVFFLERAWCFFFQGFRGRDVCTGRSVSFA